MTTTQSFSGPSLTADADDDMMQIGTSPYPHNDDFDIELDDDQGEFVEDNSMLDDATDTFEQMQDEPEANTLDDEMHDGTLYEDAIEVEHHNTVDPIVSEFDLDQTENKEQLATAQYLATNDGKEDQGNIHVEQPSEEHSEEAHDDELYDDEEDDTNVDTTTAQSDDASKAESQDEHDTYHNDTVEDLGQDPTTNTIDFAAQQPLAGTEPEPTSAGNDHHSPSEAIEAKEQEHETPELHENADPDTLESQEPYDAGQSDVPEASAPSTSDPAPALLHPIIVSYEGDDFYLFGDDVACFLQDTSLAFETMDKLLASLRELLNESLEHNDEMVLDIPSLGLHICEDSKYASQLTLAQVIDTYMLLSQNEQLAEIEPLRCHLTHRVCLETQLAYLLNCAREGKTYSEIFSEHVASPEEEQYQAEELAIADPYDSVPTRDDQDLVDETLRSNETLPPKQIVDQQDGAEGRADDDESQEYSPNDGVAYEGDFAEDANPEDTEDSGRPPLGVEDGIVSSTGGAPAEAGVNDESDDSTSNTSHTLENEFTNSDSLNGAHTEDDANEQPLDSVEDVEEDLFAEEDTHDPETSNGYGGIVPVTSGSPSGASRTENALQTAPITPSKSATSKRKLIDEDDLIDLELTPEPKRTRSS